MKQGGSGRKMAIFRRVLLGLVGLAVGLYFGLRAYLFAAQRSAIYHPRPAEAAPAGYVALDVRVPGIGVLHEWRLLAAAGQPTVIFFHGNGGGTTSFDEFGAKLHARGWGVVLAAYPGYSGNPGKPSEDSLMAAARATIAAAHADRVIVWGHSLGSGVAARMAAEGRAAGLVLEAPYTSLPDVAAMIYPYIPVYWLMLDTFNTASLVDKIKVPVLIFHSTDDPQIPFAMGQALADLFNRGVLLRATFVVLHSAGHYPHHQDITGDVVKWAQCIIHDCPTTVDG